MKNSIITTVDYYGHVIEVEVSVETAEFDKENFWKEDYQCYKKRKHCENRKFEVPLDFLCMNNLPESLVTPSPEDEYIQNDTYRHLYEAINRLPEKQRIRLIHFFFNGLDASQIAQAENVSTRAVEYSIHAALENLKKFLEKNNL